MTETSESYHPRPGERGGYRPDLPNGNVAERIVNNGDGSGVRTTYDLDGNVTLVEDLDGLPIPPQPEPTVAELQARIDALQAQLEG